MCPWGQWFVVLALVLRARFEPASSAFLQFSILTTHSPLPSLYRSQLLRLTKIFLLVAALLLATVWRERAALRKSVSNCRSPALPTPHSWPLALWSTRRTATRWDAWLAWMQVAIWVVG